MSVILSPYYSNQKLINICRCILQRSSWFLFGVSIGRNFDVSNELTNATIELYSYQHNINTTLRTVALRTFVGSCATLISSVVNLTVLMVLKGEQGWICLMCCNADSKFLVLKFRQLSKHWHLVSVLFSVLVLHWVTATDSTRNPSGSVHAALGERSEGSQLGKANRSSMVLSASRSENRRTQCVVTTECVANTKDLGSDIELDKIRVQTEQTREVEIDGRSDNSRGPHQSFPSQSSSTDNIV